MPELYNFFLLNYSNVHEMQKLVHELQGGESLPLRPHYVAGYPLCGDTPQHPVFTLQRQHHLSRENPRLIFSVHVAVILFCQLINSAEAEAVFAKLRSNQLT